MTIKDLIFSAQCAIEEYNDTLDSNLLDKAEDLLCQALKELENQNMKKRKISKWRIKRGVNFHDEMRKGKYGWNEAAHLGWF